jgi:hypothetical protein
MNTFPRRASVPDPRETDDRSVIRSLDQQIGQELRALYNEVLAEPIPDRLLTLIDELGRGDRTITETTEEVDA